MRCMRAWAISIALCVLVAASPAQPDYGFNFVTIGAPGNRGTLPEEAPLSYGPIGAVSYQFRIADEKLSNIQYLEFANAYGPYVHNLSDASDVAGRWLVPIAQSDGSYRFGLNPIVANVAAGMSWEMSARYCNWLCNDKGTDQASFENGAYDTSTFLHTFPPPHQLEHNPGARFWIPSLDELTKAVYYDPSKNGQGGYWLYPNGTDSPLVAGRPDIPGTETIGPYSITPQTPFLGQFPLGQYPNTRTPWGLLDVSGTWPDWTSTSFSLVSRDVVTVGSIAGDVTWSSHDRNSGIYTATIFGDSSADLRIASAVPSPTSVLVFVVLGFVPGRKRRQSKRSSPDGRSSSSFSRSQHNRLRNIARMTLTASASVLTIPM